jgi:hypothetical protein
MSEKAIIRTGNAGLVLGDLEAMWRWATAVASSGLAPKGLETAEKVLVATQMGAELGLAPMASLQNIAVVNGRPSVWGDAVPGICRATGEMVESEEWYEQAGKRIDRNPTTFTDDTAAVYRVVRKGEKPRTVAFSVKDAKTAGLWGKAGPWTQYPARMLLNRARTFCLRDAFPDALRGLHTAEEMRDVPAEKDVTPKPARFLEPEPIALVSDEPEPAVEPAPAPPETPQARLEAMATEAGADWAKVEPVLIEANHIYADQCKGFSDVPDDVCEKVLARKLAFTRAMKGGAK